MVGVDIQGSLLYETWNQGHMPEDPHPKTYKIEGIGEDFIPSTLDLSVINEVIQVDDAESFLMTRRLVREEGIFARGSSGSAVAGLLKSKIVQNLKPGQIAIVILSDSDNRYLSKVFDDNWMRENGFFSPPQETDTIDTLLRKNNKLPLVTSRPDERLSAVIGKMNKYDISQLPVIDEGGKLIGMISEANLLDHLMHNDHVHDPEETIAPIIDPNVLTADLESSVESVLPIYLRGKAVVIIEEGRPIGMLTKIDLIDYLTDKIV